MKIVILLWFLISCNLYASEINLISNDESQIDFIEYEDLRDLWFGRSFQVNEQTLKPLDSSDEETRHEFYKTYFHKTPLQVNRFWARKLFAGEGVMPPKRVSESDLQEAIKTSKEIVGYSIEVLDDSKPIEVRY